MNISGIHACFYWAEFPPAYLETVRKRNLSDLKDEDTIQLNRTQSRDLTDTDDRKIFIQEFIGLVLCLADGHAMVGHLRRDPDSRIHWRNRDKPSK
jgi:hypothetical protein